MLHLYNKDNLRIKGLRAYQDYFIKSDLKTGDKILSFNYPIHLAKDIKEECLIKTKDYGDFIVKEISTEMDSYNIICVMDVSALTGKAHEGFEVVEVTVENAIQLAIAGTGWRVRMKDNISKKRTIRIYNSSAWQVIQQIKKTFRIELNFNTADKIIEVYEVLGSDKGVYFIDSLNLLDLNKQSNTYDIATKIIALGAIQEDGKQLRVEVTNFQYTNQLHELIWKDERYTNINSLREDAIAKLEELSKPYRSYSVNIVDLAAISDKYKILNYGLGDIIYLVSKQQDVREKQRIIQTIVYPKEPHRNTCQIANATLSFEDIQQDQKQINDTIDNIVSSNGTIAESAIKDLLNNLVLDTISVGEFNAAIAKIGEAIINKLDVDEANIKFADIQNAIIGKADIVDLEAITGKFKILEAETANINTLLAKFITGESGQFLHLTGQNVIIDEAVIKDLIASKISVADLIAGNIDTNKFNIVSTDGGISIVGATQQFKDKNNQVRLQIGQDAQGNFNFILKGADGTTTLIDHTGIKEGAIGDNLIKENMVAENAIGEKQINYNSFITGFNKDTNSELIQSSKVAIDMEGQSLDVAFNSLKTTVDSKESRNLKYNSSFEKDLSYWYVLNSNLGSITVDSTAAYKGSKSVKIVTTNNTNVIGVHSGYDYTPELQCEPNTIYTLSLYIKTSNVVGDGAFAQLVQRDSSGTWINNVNTVLVKGTNDWTLVKVNIKTLSNAKFLHIFLYSKNCTGTVYFDAIKLEKGENPNPVYSEAPEDIKYQIDGIQIGGRNICRGIKSWVTKNAKVLAINVAEKENCVEILKKEDVNVIHAYVPFSATLDINKEYTISFKIMSTVSKTVSLNFYDIKASTNKGSLFSENLIANEWKEYKATTKIAEGDTSGIFISSTNMDVLQAISIKDLKVEIGNKATDWTPAPEDITEVTNSLETKLTIEQKNIETLIKDTTIEKNGTTVKLKDDYSTFKQEQDKINLQVSNQQSEFNKSLSIREQTKLNGLELFDQRYTSDLTARPFAYYHDRYEIVLATIHPDGKDAEPNIIKHIDGGTLLYYTEFIPATNFDNPIYGSIEVRYPGTLDGNVYLQTGFYDKDFKPMSSNDAAMNMVSNKPMTAIDKWQKFDGFVEVPVGDFRRKSAYIRFRIAVRYQGQRGDAYIRNISVKQLGGANLGGLNTTVTETKALAASMKIEQDNITSKVEDLKTSEIKNRKVGAFRYIRDYLKGNSINTGNHWVELQVLADGTNIGKGKLPTSNGTLVNPTAVTSGWYDVPSNHTSSSSSGWIYVQIDLGEVKSNVDMIKTWHYYSDKRKYNHKLWVSQDGVTWQELFNSEESGQYVETAEGRAYIINESYTESRISSTEQKVTATGVITTITEAINAGTNSFNTMQFVLDKDGATVKNGGITVKNKADKNVMWVDTNGKLSTDNLEVFGTGNNTVNFRGNGSKSINLRSDNKQDLWLNFQRGNDTKSRIGVYAEEHRSGQLFIEPGSNINGKAMVIMRGANSTNVANEPIDVEIHGRLRVTDNVTSKFGFMVASDTINQLIITSKSDGSPYIHVASDVGAYGITVWASDMMLKTDFDYTKETALDKIMKIEHAEYSYKDESREKVKLGIIAQQLELIEEQWVMHVDQSDGSYIVQPDAGAIIPYVTKAMQEQQEEVEQLKDEITNLKEMVKTLVK